MIAGHFRLAHAFIRLGRLDQAEHVTASALDVLQRVASPAEPSPETLSLYGAMHLVQAVISGQESDRSRAHPHLAEAKRIGEQLGSDRNDFETEFGPTNVQLHAVAVAIELGDAGEALDVARGIDASGLSSERQARLLVDVARAHGQRRHTGEATKALLDAECLAPEHVRSRPLTHSTIRDLIDRLGRRAPTDLVELARRSAAMR
jgi:hypothetical protein